MINRSAVIVRPKQPYVDWATSLDDSEIKPKRDGEQTIYLIPEYGDDKESSKILELVYDLIFEQELHGWHRREDAWPKNRSLSLFLDWFDVEFHSVIEDLYDFPLLDDDG